ncbi:MAG: hypothetical protein QM493_02545 [Sulfurovum sp.]
MTLIEIFTEYVRERKSLRDYVEERKSIDSRGEFNNNKLIKAQENLDRLKEEEPEIYELMYQVLERYYIEDKGYTIEYPIDFVREVLKMYQNSLLPKEVYELYLKGLSHPCRDA